MEAGNQTGQTGVCGGVGTEEGRVRGDSQKNRTEEASGVRGPKTDKARD